MRMMVTVGATVVAVLSGAGCYVASVAPLYSNDAVVLDDGLPGTWVNDDGDTWWITSAEHPLKSYTLEKLDNTSFFRSDTRKVTSTFVVHLFKIDENVFLDAVPGEEAIPDEPGRCEVGPSWWALRAPMHYLLYMSRQGDVLWFRDLDAAKLDAVLHQELSRRGPAAQSRLPVLLPHLHLIDDGTTYSEPGGPSGANLVLTGPTADIQSFMGRHLTEVLDGDEQVMRRRR